MYTKFAKGFLLPQDEYFGRWILCDSCGCQDNIETADYCSGCGKRLRVVGTAKRNYETFGWNKTEY